MRGPKAFLFLILVGGGCYDTRGAAVVQRDTSAPIQTSALHYDFSLVHLGIEVTIEFVYRNQTTHSVYLLTCPGWPVVEIQKQVGNAWNRVWPDDLSARRTVVRECPAGRTLLPPGEEYADTARIFGGRARNQTYPQFEMERMAGVYRLVLVGLEQSSVEAGSEVTVNLADRVSNSFSLSAPPGFP